VDVEWSLNWWPPVPIGVVPHHHFGANEASLVFSYYAVLTIFGVDQERESEVTAVWESVLNFGNGESFTVLSNAEREGKEKK